MVAGEELCFQVGDAFIEESVVRAGGLESFAEAAVLIGEFADSAFQTAVLGEDALDGVLGVFGLEVTDLAEEDADALALGC